MILNTVENTTSCALIVPTYNGKEDLSRLLKSLECQTLKFDLFIVDSSSSDGTIEIAKSTTNNVEIIPGSEFNHGGTRQMMVDKHPGYDIYIFMTQDAFLEDVDALKKLVAYFEDNKVGAVCGRQLPHHDANPLAIHARIFNYPEDCKIKSFEDSTTFGIKTVFISNSFAAYRAEALVDAGGFPDHVIFAEDMYVLAKMVLKGWKTAYAGDACCRHSHNYTILEEFRRYFDMGVMHAREPWIKQSFGSAGGEGLRFVKSELKFLGWSRFYLLPSALVRNALKLSAYKIGQKEANLPIGLKKCIGMYRGYWNQN